MLEYEFENVRCDKGGGMSFFGGIGMETLDHQKIILRRAAEGWRYVGFIPRQQGSAGFMVSIDLVFERERKEAE